MQYLPLGKDERMTKEQARRLHCTVEASLALVGGKYKTMDRWGADWFRRMGLPVPCKEEI